MPNFPGYGTPQAPIDPFVRPDMPIKPGPTGPSGPSQYTNVNAPNVFPPRVGRSFPRPTMPPPQIPIKGQYRQGLPGGPGGGPGLGRQPMPQQQQPRQGPPGTDAWNAALAAWRAQRPEMAQQLGPFQAAIEAWKAQRPQDMSDMAAVQAWRAAQPQFPNDRSGMDPAFAAWRQAQPNRQDFMPPQIPHDAPRLKGGSQKGGIPFGGFRKKGGHVNPRSAYVVGEEGPEVIVPESRGTVVPSNRFGGSRTGHVGGGGTRTQTPTTPTPTTPDTWENAQYGVNEYGGKGHIPGETIQEYFKRNMLAVLKGHAAAGDFNKPGTNTPPTTPPPGSSGGIPLPPATGGVGVGGGPMSPGMAFTLNNMTPMRGFQFPQYTQTWAMNPDVFGRTY